MEPKKSEAPEFTQEDLAIQLGMSVDTLQNYKVLADMIPELKPQNSVLAKTWRKYILCTFKNQKH